MRLVILTLVARTTCGAPVPVAKLADDPCPPLPPVPAGVAIEVRLHAPSGFRFTSLPVRVDSTRLAEGTYVDVVLQPDPLPTGERPPARTIAHDRLFVAAGRAMDPDLDLWLSPIHRATVLTEEDGVAALTEASAEGTLSLVPSDGRRGLGCDPAVRDYRRWWVATVERGHPAIATPARPPPSAVELEVPALQAAAWSDTGTFVDVVLEASPPRTVARGVLFQRAVWHGASPSVSLLADPSSAAAIREGAALGALTLVPAADVLGLGGDPEVQAFARSLRW